jgi:ELWxxDGT repeat protein
VLYLSHGDELWMSAGGNSTTRRLKELAPEATFSAPRQLRGSGAKLFFTAEEAATGRELWVLHPAELRGTCPSP